MAQPPRQYPGGKKFVVYSPDGGSFAYYPSGRMAAAYERMGGGFYCYLYNDKGSSTGKGSTTMCAFDPSGCGYVAFENGKPRLTSQKHGGTLLRADGSIERSWSAMKPLKGDPVVLEITPNISFSFKNRNEIRAVLSCQGLTQEYALGEVLKMSTESYLQKSLGVVKMGPERGKHILDIDKCRQSAHENRMRRQALQPAEVASKARWTEADMQKLPELKQIVRATDELQASVQRGDWDVKVYVDKAQLTAQFGDSLPTLKLDQTMLKGDSHSQTLEGMAATQPDTLELMLRNSVFDKRALPLSKQIKAASGRYRPDHGEHYTTRRKRLLELKDANYETFLSDAPKGTIVVVCCLAGWLPQCRRAEPMIELLNGELQTQSKAGPKGGRPPPPMLLTKFDMCHSRILRDRHNIHTMPMYLMYYDGKLAYASNTLNGFGSSKDDLVEQARQTLADAQGGHFLPADFKFGQTSNKLVESFSSTLGATAPILGAGEHPAR